MFIDPSEKATLFFGGGGKSTLMHRLSQDISASGQTVAIFSTYPTIMPMEAHMVITPEIKHLKTELEQELQSSSVLYLGKKLNNDRLEAFSHNELMQLLKMELPVDRIFIEADNTDGRSVSGYRKLTLNYRLDRCINVIGADAFNKQKSDNWIKSRDSFWNTRDMLSPLNLAEWIDSRDIMKKIQNKKIPVTFFLNKVENIFTQNLALAFGKKIKQSGFDRVVIGSVFNSQFQLIE